MTKFAYSLDKTSYSWKNALLWGNFVAHCRNVNKGSLGHRIVAAVMAAIEFLPIISQISSICEKIIVGNLLPAPPASSKSPLVNKKILEETKNAAHQGIPKPNAPIKSQSWENYKIDLLSQLPTVIESQRKNKTYKREKLVDLLKAHENIPIPLSNLPKSVKYFSEKTTFYSYNAEGIRDYNWGCAWRAIQTCLSAYSIHPSFEELFHLFGPLPHLKRMYESKYPGEQLPNTKVFAPYDLSSGWAEPFIGHMAMHFYDIPSVLTRVNGIPGYCNAPQDVFKHSSSLNFYDFKERLLKHFKQETPAPVMIDDAMFALNIVGLEEEGLNITLWIADPHIQQGINTSIDKDLAPAGLYKVTLDPTGRQIKCSLADEHSHQLPNMFCKGSYEGLHFDTKHWMVLFPLNKN
ncbi:MAG: hypothetical protein BGO14_01385 [Chlamydiales bacterium 38-26]|nr:hypothetical protein [Chlamydiales bacterium]OJV08100.1 MAG: hypothetical protein BGO14_01385 [Chlamydiales bacterium 38-26]